MNAFVLCICAFQIFLRGKYEVFTIEMAASASIPFYTSNGVLDAPKVSKAHKIFMSHYPELLSKKPVNCARVSSSADFTPLRSSFPVKPLQLEGNRETQQKFGVLCHAVGLKNGRADSFSVGKKFQLDDVIEAQQFDRDTLSAIFEVAREMEKVEKNSPGSQILKGYLMATLFYEPSTRTRLSFESAMKRLGGEVLTTENAREFSSAAKGETLEGRLLSFLHDWYWYVFGVLWP